ncbi:MAG: flagellar basal body P-ring formation chaperone FlgA [Vogesella sp.]|uniref:flagellar basal body P-ring formation chaperone FlgA n=1 Tax=Vogesella sp. TaxID=1904252 RepID=UPI00391AEA45
MNKIFFGLLGLLLTLNAAAVDKWPPERVAQAFLQAQRGVDGYEYRLQSARQKVQMPACQQALQAAWPAGSTAPRNAVEVACPALGWSLRLPVQATALPVAVIATRLLRRGEVLTAADVRLAPVAQNRQSQGLRDLQDVLGKMIDATVPAGAMLQGAQLRAPYVVKMNQPVRLLARGEGFAVGSDATALGNAGVGERVNVRVASGKVVSAVVEADGSVSVNVP